MKESDWKKFKIIKEKAIERFCTETLEEFGQIISNSEEHIHNRYLQLYTQVQDRNKEMARIFDGHSRNNAWCQLIAMRARGLADESLLAELSEEFLQQTDPKRFG
ncbi:hypothetical protein [Lacimicrobium alkaliphilum]|uniref:Peptide ABC transporter substrate-binding protein n=1 Tax=Lacimicrobium alkaliphilum TaxID=1526571 RepID=A0ABQ1RG42_9ALTE|nr:hypothetical protein [Lacimicrobium alkaliphilum]GGD65938.1 hypothetical protein GCM10011357_21460 [Lacimicrobium alkaliphilum]